MTKSAFKWPEFDVKYKYNSNFSELRNNPQARVDFNVKVSAWYDYVIIWFPFHFISTALFEVFSLNSDMEQAPLTSPVDALLISHVGGVRPVEPKPP